MASLLIDEAEANMKKSLDVIKKEFAGLRAGRAAPALLDKVMVSYYGNLTPVNQLANITAPEARLLVIQPWDKAVLPEIEKAIRKSDLGINPTSDGTLIRLVIPQLTQERRLELVKVIKKKAEEGRVAVRNIRRETNEILKQQQKKGELSEDEFRRQQEEVQKLTDKHIKEIDHLVDNKEQDIMRV